MQKPREMLSCSLFSRRYWTESAREFGNLQSLTFAAVIVALRIAVKFFKIPLFGDALNLTFDCYVNSVGSLIYGPLVGLAVGFISDNLGFLISPSGVYFPLFSLVEMTSSFLFALFFWRRRVTVPRALAAKFSVNLVCNIIMNSLFIKIQYQVMGAEKVYPFINLARIVKNLVLFPLEAVLIVLVLTGVMPALRQIGAIPKQQNALRWRASDVVLTAALAALSVGLVFFYFFFLKDWVSVLNIKWL